MLRVMLSVTNKPFMLSVIMLIVVILNVVILNVVAPSSVSRINSITSIKTKHMIPSLKFLSEISTPGFQHLESSTCYGFVVI